MTQQLLVLESDHYFTEDMIGLRNPLAHSVSLNVSVFVNAHSLYP